MNHKENHTSHEEVSPNGGRPPKEGLPPKEGHPLSDGYAQQANTGFRYTYSAKEQAELKRIREKYSTDIESPTLSAMDRIRKLDAGVTKKGTITALIVGIVGTLVMGLGMSLIMTDLMEFFGADRDTVLIVGILIGFVGMVGVIVAYPLFQHITTKERQKIAPEILRLTEELLPHESAGSHPGYRE